ncbi:hypothetical protein TREVI0001_1703 [Treponema vincentii ATCC 35580]|uniref:Uncharacterized protein n=1 Tax=Treponema vincentii ATCC 35580 TaxID=596324 RepID=C8PNY4_9SPIR|nr:hypothetical protein TREVI0001_1703 [Treponema vincentii ATCC 35580]
MSGFNTRKPNFYLSAIIDNNCCYSIIKSQGLKGRKSFF